ncbi:hypothetical protein BS78_K190800 [Paspalum vaginatum]|uniref:TF-B3 domain-containing protein n=1 Tax=Paspalum vaginatum TaxID=158149 RepID=A0A9W8CD45_9POAL|nr:hypothetical protein BS78_K190800 [Paspalum vaginatum]
MAIDQPLKRKRGRPPGSHSQSQSAKSKMEQKMALVKQRLALLDSASSSSSSSSQSGKDDDFAPTGDELAIVAAHQPVVIHCSYTDDDDVTPLEVLKANRVESEQKKLPGAPQAHDSQSIITGTTNTAKACDVNGQNISARNCGSALTRAKEVQAKLRPEHPSFIKNMLQSHVVRGFWLGLPTDFCNKHLPKHDVVIMLEDENGHDHKTTYLGTKQGLSAGWRGFALKHDIKVGDVVVFHLVRSTRFKVYIVRANEFTTTDGAISLLDLEACKKGKLSREGKFDGAKSKDDGAKASALDYKKVPWSNGSNAAASEAIDGLRVSDSDVNFSDVTSFSDFNIVVDSLVIDCKLHEQARRTYYELCRSQKAFLHEHLLKQLNLTLVVGVIMETISIAEGIRACKAQASSSEDLVIWKKTLESLELLGMNVGFLLKRVSDLLGLPAADLSECQKYREVKAERSRAAEKVRALELLLSNVKDTLRKMDSDMEEMESSVKRSSLTLQRLAAAPW